MYESLSVASRLSSMVKDRTQIFYLAYHIRRMNHKLSGIFEELYLVLEGKKPAPPPEPMSPERIQTAINSFRQLYSIMSGITAEAKRKRLFNNSLLAGQLLRLTALSDEVLELSDWIEMAVQERDQVDRLFVRAKAEKDRGEIYDISQVN